MGKQVIKGADDCAYALGPSVLYLPIQHTFAKYAVSHSYSHVSCSTLTVLSGKLSIYALVAPSTYLYSVFLFQEVLLTCYLLKMEHLASCRLSHLEIPLMSCTPFFPLPHRNYHLVTFLYL